jgi:hypothetical protein
VSLEHFSEALKHPSLGFPDKETNLPGHEHSGFPFEFTLHNAFGPHSFSQTFMHFLFLHTKPKSGQSSLLVHSPSTCRIHPFVYGSPTCFDVGHLHTGPFAVTSQIAEGWQLVDEHC